MATVDVTVRGAGIFGLSCAWALVSRGAMVRVVDPNGVAAGASGGIVGALAPHTPDRWNEKKAFQLNSLLAAEPFWNAVAQAGGLSAGYARLGRLQPLADARAVELAQARVADAAENWGAAAQWLVVPAQSGWYPHSPSGWSLFDTLTARIHPAQACAALAAGLRAKGVQIVADAPDEGQILWATGAAGLADLSHDLGQPIGAGIKGQAALFALDRRDQPQVFVDGLHIVPHADATVAVGSTTERAFDTLTPDALVEDLIARAKMLCPDLAAAPVVRRWAGLRPRARSRAPLLGAWPGRPGHFVANGGFKIGFGMAPGVAQVMADLMLDQTDHIPSEFTFGASLKPETMPG